MSKSVTEKQVVVDERLIKPSMVTPTLFVGLGGWGCKIIKRVAKHLKGRHDYAERYKKIMRFAGVDTNINDLEKCRNEFDEWFLISDFEKAKYAELSTGKLYLEPDTYFTQWVPEDYRFRVGDTAGAGQIRIESRLGCYYQMKHSPLVDRFRRLLEQLRDHDAGHRRLDSSEIRIVICYSVAGGTGSGSHLAMAYMLREQAKLVGKPTVIGLAGMPSIFEDNAGVNKDGIFANGYAALKETEHLMKLGAPESTFFPENGLEFHFDPSDESKRRVYDKPFDFLYVVDKPEKFSVKAVDEAAADGLYLQLFTDIFKEQAGDYDNYTQHQRFLVPHDFEAKDIPGFTSFYGSFGAAVLHVPTADMVDYIGRLAAVGVLESNWLRDVPGGDDYKTLRLTKFKEYNQVTRKDGPDQTPVPVAKFQEEPDQERGELLDRLYLKRIRMLAHAEYENNQQTTTPFMAIWRHGEGIEGVPNSNADIATPETLPAEIIEENSERLTQYKAECSVAAMVYASLRGVGEERFAVQSVLFEHAMEAAKATTRAGLKFPEESKVSSSVGTASEIAKKVVRQAEEALLAGDTEHFGFELISKPEELFKLAKLDIKAQRYVAIRIKDELKGALGSMPKELGTEPEIKLPDDWATKEVVVGGASKGQKISDVELAGKLNSQVLKIVEHKLTLRLRELLNHALSSYQKVIERYRTLEDTVQRCCEDERSLLKKLLQGGGAAANRYTLDAEAFQMENGQRLWDFYYEDQVVRGMEDKLSTKAEKIQNFVRDAYLRGDGPSDPKEQHVKLLGLVREYVVGLVREKLEGDPLAKDEDKRRGLDIHASLELEVLYRAIYMSHREELAKAEGNPVRSLIAEYHAGPPKDKVRPSDPIHQDYLKDKLRRIVKEKADYLCVYDESRDAQGGVRPDRVQLCVMTEGMKASMGGILRQADDSFKVLTEEWTNPREIVFYKAVLNVPLYVFGRMDRMRDYYYRFRNMAKRSKVLHIDKNWEGDALFDLDPVSAQEKKRAEQVRANIVQYATLRVTGANQKIQSEDATGEAARFLFRRESEWRLQTPRLDGGDATPGTTSDVSLGESMSDAVRNLPGVLASNPVRYAPYNQMLAAVQKGLAPHVLKAIGEFPKKWRISRDDLQGQWGANPSIEQRHRLKDLGEAYAGLAVALTGLLARLREQQGEAAVLGGDDFSSIGIERALAQRNIEASIQVLQRFSDDWKALENPTARGFASWLFEPLAPEELQTVVKSEKPRSSGKP